MELICKWKRYIVIRYHFNSVYRVLEAIGLYELYKRFSYNSLITRGKCSYSKAWTFVASISGVSPGTISHLA